jgi:hypothetical protein
LYPSFLLRRPDSLFISARSCGTITYAIFVLRQKSVD